MSFRVKSLGRSFGAIAGALLVLAAAPARAEEPAPTPVPAPATKPSALRVFVDVGASDLDPQRIRGAIARELSSNVELAESGDTPLRIVCTSDQRVSVFYKNDSGEELSRVVDLPQDAERKVEVIALMVGNLTRNEAAELLAALQPKPEAKPPEPAAPAPPPPPARAAPKGPDTADPELGSGYLYAKQPGANASLYFPTAVLRDSDRRVLALEASAAYGRVGALQGIGFSLGVLRVEHQVQGLALALGATRVDGPVRGVQLGAFYNEGYGNQVGLNLSSGLIYQRATVTGIVASGLVALTKDVDGIGVAGVLDVGRNLRGVHVAGVAAIATGRVDGVQIAGALQSSEEINGIAIAGAVNRAAATRGFAVSGAVNVTGDLDGVAISLVNVGGRVRGAQVGLVNVATKDVRGYQLGLVNYAHDNGHVQLQAFGDTLLPLNAGLKFTTGFGYSEFGFGTSGSANSGHGYVGLGVHFPVGRLSFDVGGRVSASTRDDPSTGGPERTDVHYLGQVGLRIVRGIELFGGGGARHGVLGKGAGQADPEFLGGVAFF
ncbi:MAG TPA: hypothetical protein VFQ35_03125 [Polyangiaceae bacterium]|nr:hypothetical protein [Polyangiaceae bacterium]